jgi:hypothetical protein
METTHVSAKEMKKLEGFQYKCLRSILHKTWRDNISYVKVLKETKMYCIAAYLSRNKLLYAGKIQRMEKSGPNARLPVMMLHSVVEEGKRDRAPPHLSWRETFRNDLIKFNIDNVKPNNNKRSDKSEDFIKWEHLAQDEVGWTDLVNKGMVIFQQKWCRNKEDSSERRHNNDTDQVIEK